MARMVSPRTRSDCLGLVAWLNEAGRAGTPSSPWRWPDQPHYDRSMRPTADQATPPDAGTSSARDGAYLLLRRAIKNAGDYLIFDRARRLISAWHPDARVDMGDAWRPLHDQMPPSEIGRYRAVVIAGGPGYALGLARTYPIGDLDRLPPVVMLALGSFILPGTEEQVASFRFSRADRRFLDGVLRRTAFLGARDPLTARMLAANGYDRVLMTGDPAWYDLAYLTRPAHMPAALDRVALTPPANPYYVAQAQRLFERLGQIFTDTAFVMVHHRGVQIPFARLASRHGWPNAEISGSVDGFQMYDGVSAHVGYRVHAHLYAASHSIPSYLIAEDSRGIGMIEAFGGLGIAGFRPTAGTSERIVMRALPRLADQTRPSRWRLGPIGSTIMRPPDVSGCLADQIADDLQRGFQTHLRAQQTIRDTLPAMQRMVATLP